MCRAHVALFRPKCVDACAFVAQLVVSKKNNSGAAQFDNARADTCTVERRVRHAAVEKPD